MKELEQLIIGSCFGEDQYRKVSFLEPEDFTNYPDKPYREYFKVLKKANADSQCLAECIVKAKDKRLRELLVSEIHSLGANTPDRLGLKLLEVRFKILFADLLNGLAIHSKKNAERELLGEALMTLVKEDTDIFDISDHILEYLGVHASDFTQSRINSFLSYRDKRVHNAKKVINELR